MNTLSQNRYNMRYKQNIPWNHTRPVGNFMQRKHYFNSSWAPQTLPGSEKYWCETCDKGFMTKTLLNYHEQRHQKCNIDGCQFVAHPKIITKHIEMQHATGLYKRIGKLNNPEEIKKWREERKRRYPTKENIEKRQAEIKEKIRRGEKMGLKRNIHGIPKNKSGFYGTGQQNGTREKYTKTVNNKKLKTTQTSNKKKPFKKIDKIPPPKEETRKLQPFKGIQDLLYDDTVEEDKPEECNDLIEDDEDISDKDPSDKAVSKPSLCGALTSLICNYESTDEEDIDESTNITPHKPSSNLNSSNAVVKLEVKNNENKDLRDSNQSIENNLNMKNSRVSNNLTVQNDSDADSGPEETCIVKGDTTTNDDLKSVKCLPTKKQRLLKHENAKNRHKIVNLKRKLPSTLLEKLLHKEILHERNVILQCVRYVVKNKYFDEM